MKKLAAFLLLLAATAGASAQPAIPELWGTPVHDEAGILSPQTIHALEQKLKLHEDSTSNQIAILTLPTLEGEPLEDFSIRVVEQWKLGQKGKDNGVLLLIVTRDRKMRIEVGYGLEGALPDILCSQIIRNEMAPRFRQGDFDGGVNAAVEAIIRAIAGEYTVESTTDAPQELDAGARVLMGLFVFVILGIFTWAALFSEGCAGWFLYVFLIPFYAIFPGVALGVTGGLALLVVYLVGYLVLKLWYFRTAAGKAFYEKMRMRSAGRSSGRGWSTGAGWFGGGWSSGGGGGGWSGGGGFSGGGGSFGGGGASGSW
jgi:uncharacterized protein